MSAAFANNRRTLLKEATQHIHVELDALLSRLDLSRRAEYCQYMQATAAAVIGLELALEASGVDSVMEDWVFRRRRFSLALDLHALELTAVPVDVRRHLSAAAMLGVLYVLEGSRLGAQVLLRRVNASSDESVLAARNFLRSSEPQLWQSFLRTLETFSIAPDPVELLDAARYAFEIFRGAFAEYCSPAPLIARRAHVISAN